MPAIKATNSKNIKVINSVFSGFETDIELDNVEGFTSEGNSFSGTNPQELVNRLIDEIKTSRLDNSSKSHLYKEIFDYLSSKEKNPNSVKKNILALLGKTALDYFVQLSAAVSAGLIINRIK